MLACERGQIDRYIKNELKQNAIYLISFNYLLIYFTLENVYKLKKNLTFFHIVRWSQIFMHSNFQVCVYRTNDIC